MEVERCTGVTFGPVGGGVRESGGAQGNFEFRTFGPGGGGVRESGGARGDVELRDGSETGRRGNGEVKWGIKWSSVFLEWKKKVPRNYGNSLSSLYSTINFFICL